MVSFAHGYHTRSNKLYSRYVTASIGRRASWYGSSFRGWRPTGYQVARILTTKRYDQFNRRNRPDLKRLYNRRLCDSQLVADLDRYLLYGVRSFSKSNCFEEMKIWSIPVNRMCGKHLISEHRDLHTIWGRLTHNPEWQNDPEITRWTEHLGALWVRHEEQVHQLKRTRHGHNSPITMSGVTPSDGLFDAPASVLSWPEERALLAAQKCFCQLDEDHPDVAGLSE